MSDILLVCGHGRCGSSLTMQMLDAGGYPVVGEYPAYEPDEGGWWQDRPAEWIAAASGKAFKLLEPQLWAPPEGPRYRCIWLKRDPLEQARSALKMLAATTPIPTPTRSDARRMAASYSRDTKIAARKLKASGIADVLTVDFENMVSSPLATAKAITSWLGRPLDVDRMARQALRRPAACLPFLMEGLQCQRAELGLGVLA